MDRKKILWLASWYPNRTDWFDGDFIQRHAQAAALYDDIYVIRVVPDAQATSYNTPETEIKTSPGLTEHIVYYKKDSSTTGRFISTWRWMNYFKTAIKNYIKTHGKPSLVHVHVPMKAGLLALWLKRNYKIPFIVTEHLGIYNEVDAFQYRKRNFLFKYYTKQILWHAAKFLTVSEYLGKGVNRIVTPKEFEVLPNVVNTDLFYYKPKNETNKFRFIHVSNMVPLKNVEGILETVKLIKQATSDFQFIFVGNKDDSKTRLSEKSGLDDVVIFKGEISYENVAREMREANVLILFSDIENSPCVIGEALCCGLPVIATKTGGIPELVNSYNGYLVSPRDVVSLADAMKKIMLNYQQFDRLNISKEAISKFNYNTFGKQLHEIYNQVIAK